MKGTSVSNVVNMILGDYPGIQIHFWTREPQFERENVIQSPSSLRQNQRHHVPNPASSEAFYVENATEGKTSVWESEFWDIDHQIVRRLPHSYGTTES